MRTILILLVFFMSGCITTTADRVKRVLDQYESLNLEDGVTLEEAMIIAQKALIRENMVKFYDLQKPKQAKDVDDLPRAEQFWFITFKEKKTANIEFIFMTVIDKKNGDIKFANDFKEDKKWILEGALLSD